ncbi:MAG: hypothetical protein J6B93_05590 [Clostridia bacterium]|nr:hypothetical protein [Clostridia bacterium]
MNIHENLIKITGYEVLGQLPDPFIMKDGGIADTPDKWRSHRATLLENTVKLQYGDILPEPEVFRVEPLYYGMPGRSNIYKIIAGTKEKQASFRMKVFRPETQGKFPVVIDGDGCFDYAYDKDFHGAFTKNGLVFALFDRTELAHDIRKEGRRQGALYEVYPEYNFGALMAWAWGYSRCVDALMTLPYVDTELITFTGHSRGGKTAMLAGVLDERAAIVNPNSTCAGGCGCYRIHLKAITEDGEERVSETLDDIYNKFGLWFNEELGEYCGREAELPFDSHFLKALVAPRTLFVSESASDIWANPVGSWMTTTASNEVYKMLGDEQGIYWYFRRGYHYHEIEDVRMLVNLIKYKQTGSPLSEEFFKTPFKKPEPIFDWRAPENEA